jgi:hypothetical protein
MSFPRRRESTRYGFLLLDQVKDKFRRNDKKGLEIEIF